MGQSGSLCWEHRCNVQRGQWVPVDTSGRRAFCTLYWTGSKMAATARQDKTRHGALLPGRDAQQNARGWHAKRDHLDALVRCQPACVPACHSTKASASRIPWSWISMHRQIQSQRYHPIDAYFARVHPETQEEPKRYSIFVVHSVLAQIHRRRRRKDVQQILRAPRSATNNVAPHRQVEYAFLGQRSPPPVLPIAPDPFAPPCHVLVSHMYTYTIDREHVLSSRGNVKSHSWAEYVTFGAR